jgi:hypothetical protein
MPGPVTHQPPEALTGAGRPPFDVTDRYCAALARSADSINQHAKHVAEAAEGARAAAAKCKAIREALVAKHG